MQSLLKSLPALEIDGGTEVGVGGSRKVEVDGVKVAEIEMAKIESQPAN